MEGLQERLKKTGLTGNESKVYLELLKQGELSANEIAKKLSMDRTLAYTVLNHLLEKGMVSYVIRDSKKFFNSEDPENLLNSVRKTQVFIEDLLPDLRKIEQIKDTPFKINVYEGKEGVRTFSRLIMKHKIMCSFGATGRAYDYLYETPTLVKQLEKKGFSAKIITLPKYKNHPMIKVKNIQTRYLDIKSEATTSIFGNYVSIHILTQKPLVILIQNKEVVESYQNHFEVLWKSAKK